ncbi:MAG: helix-turn-helix transcriptional regulator [Parcubacteria group bacterium]|nr:helix-turn-helix transcriptional regulator [Parcubacteria group bacterium]
MRRKPRNLEAITNPLERTLATVGERYTLEVIAVLSQEKPKRFQELLRHFHSISPTTLSTRLKKLVREGIVARKFFSEVPPHVEYRLTEKGEELSKALGDIGKWGNKYLT